MGKVSVVIRTYNRPEYLEGAIQTALQQTYDPLTVIVVDDGSEMDYATDLTANHERARCIRHEENRGAAAAMNTGIEATEGDFIAFLDDDDRWHETKTERQVAALTERPRAGLADCLKISVRPDGELISLESSAPDGDLSRETLIRNAVGSPSRVLLRRAVISEYRFDEALPTKNDWDFFLRVCQEWPVVLVPERLYVRTHHPSISSDPVVARRDRLRVIQKHEETIRANGCWERTMATHHANLGRKLFETRNRNRARHHLHRAVTLRPTAKYLALLAFTYFPWIAFTIALRSKRITELYRHGSSCTEELSRAVPGFPPERSPT